jgi:hypothetical protein
MAQAYIMSINRDGGYVNRKSPMSQMSVTVKNKLSLERLKSSKSICHMALARPSNKQVKPFVSADTKSPIPSIFLATFLAAPRLTPWTAFWIPVIVLVMLFIFPVRTLTKVSVRPWQSNSLNSTCTTNSLNGQFEF